MPFSKLGLTNSLTKNLTDSNYKKPYPIQQQSIPAIIKGKDLLGIAQTGSGKTAAYVLPILSILKPRKDGKNRNIDALVLVPTRELAIQVQEVFKTYNISLKKPLNIKAVFGGVSINPQMKNLFTFCCWCSLVCGGFALPRTWFFWWLVV